jgi:hypothetical protein
MACCKRRKWLHHILIEEKRVIAVLSSALFDLSESDQVFREQGPVEYKQFQADHLDACRVRGVSVYPSVSGI